MNWPAAIETHKAALLRIVAELVAMVGVAQGAVGGLVPAGRYWMALGLLRRTESAVRRLIVVAARGVKVEPKARRAWPQGLQRPRKSEGGATRPMAFKLFDTRKRLSFDDGEPKPETSIYIPYRGPRVWLPGVPSVLAELPRPLSRPSTRPIPDIDTTPLCRRLEAVKRALEDLPRQARRMARWIRRQAEKPAAPFRSPLRPGAPPGHRDRGREEIDRVLKECHTLALFAMEPNTS